MWGDKAFLFFKILRVICARSEMKLKFHFSRSLDNKKTSRQHACGRLGANSKRERTGAVLLLEGQGTAARVGGIRKMIRGGDAETEGLPLKPHLHLEQIIPVQRPKASGQLIAEEDLPANLNDEGTRETNSVMRMRHDEAGHPSAVGKKPFCRFSRQPPKPVPATYKHEFLLLPLASTGISLEPI